MVVVFEHSYLQELYENGKTTEKKHRFQPDVIKKYRRRIEQLLAAVNPEALYQIKALHFEALVGDKKGLFSVKVNLQYRIEFTIANTVDQPSLYICNIVELSNHYT